MTHTAVVLTTAKNRRPSGTPPLRTERKVAEKYVPQRLFCTLPTTITLPRAPRSRPPSSPYPAVGSLLLPDSRTASRLIPAIPTFLDRFLADASYRTGAPDTAAGGGGGYFILVLSSGRLNGDLFFCFFFLRYRTIIYRTVYPANNSQRASGKNRRVGVFERIIPV